MKTIGIINQNFETFDYEKDYDYAFKTTDVDEAIAFLSDKNADEYTIEEYSTDIYGGFEVGSNFDTVENFLKRHEDIRYWLETSYNGDAIWALHKVTGEYDKIVVKCSYEDTPDYVEPVDNSLIEASWQAIDKYIEGEIGFVPEYEVN